MILSSDLRWGSAWSLAEELRDCGSYLRSVNHLEKTKVAA